MLQSFYTGNTGLNANKEWLGVISDNISNVNTTGFKQERVNFSDLVASSLTTYSTSGAPRNKEIGGGVFVANTIKDFSQGSFKNTNQPLSLALDGEGFFMVKNPSADLVYYTRAGDFRVDANGDVINPAGMKLQGWALDNAGNIAGAMGSINIPNNLDPINTDKVSFENPANLDAGVDPITTTFNPSNPSTYHYVNTLTTYDSLGTSHVFKQYFVKTGINTWKVYTQIDDRALAYKNGDQSYAAIELVFNGKGEITKASYEEPLQTGIDGTVSNSANISKDTTVTTTSRYYLRTDANIDSPILRNSLKINSIGGTAVNYIDDGNGKIIDLDNNNQVVGTIDYENGILDLNDTTLGDIDANIVINGNTIPGISFTEDLFDTIYNNLTVRESEDSGSFYVSKNLLAGTIYITQDPTGNSVQWNDDGQGNIIDITTGDIRGSVDYSTGKITLIGTAGDNKPATTINISYNVIRDAIKQQTLTESGANTNEFDITGETLKPRTVEIYYYDLDGNGDDDDTIEKNVKYIFKDDGNGNLIAYNANQEPITIGQVIYDDGNGNAKITITDSNLIDSANTSQLIVKYTPQNVNRVSDIENIQTENVNYNRVDSRFLNNGAVNTPLSLNFRNLTQLDSDFIFYAQQNGAGKGDLMSISVTEDGVIKGTYTNGQVKSIARLAVATFKDKEILVRKGDNLYLPNQQTFTPIIVPGGVISKIRSGMLEMSNVDISQEFINLITAQRAYQASAKTITTSDQILQTTMDIKR